MNKYQEVLKEYFGFDEFREYQLDVQKAIIEKKRDVCAIMFTGAGKSLCFQFPAIYTKKISLIISPLISLMADQKDKFDGTKVRVCCMNSNVSYKNKLKDEILNGKYDLVYVTPEFAIAQQDFIKQLIDQDMLCLIAIDEAHCASNWGFDFRESYKELSCLKKIAPNIPILALTATATPQVQKDIIEILKLNKPYVIKTSFDRPNIYIEVKMKKDIVNDIMPLIIKGFSIIYCQTRKDTDEICEILQHKKIKCGAYHAGLALNQRAMIQEKFCSGEIACIIATCAFGMGIDKDVKTVIHYGASKDLESYYQEVGRAGRNGKPAECYTFHRHGDFSTNSFFINQIESPTYRQRKMTMLKNVKQYLDTKECRRSFILKYFGEIYNKDNCNNCDNCKRQVKVLEIDFTVEATILLTLLNEMSYSVGATNTIKILKGHKSMIKFKHLKTYGKGINYPDDWWKIFIRMMITNEYLLENPIPMGHGSTISKTLFGVRWLSSKSTLKLVPPDDMLNLKYYKSLKPEVKIKPELSLDPEISKPEKQQIIKKPTKTNYKISNSVLGTYKLLQKNMPVQEIMEIKSMSEKTLSAHIVELYQNNYDIDLEKFGLTEKKYQNIKNILNGIPDYGGLRLRFLIKRMPKDVTYLDIKLTMNKIAKTFNSQSMQKCIDNCKEILDNYKRNNEKINEKYNEIKKLFQ